MLIITRPNFDEYTEFYAGYVARIGDQDVLEVIHQQHPRTLELLRSISEDQALFRPAPGEWTIKEVVGHMSDTERVFAYRALRFSRNDPQELLGFEQDDYIRESIFNDRLFSDLIDEFEALRRANLYLFQNLTPEMLLRRGIASKASVTVRALVYMTAGHEIHHYESLKTDYLPLMTKRA